MENNQIQNRGSNQQAIFASKAEWAAKTSNLINQGERLSAGHPASREAYSIARAIIRQNMTHRAIADALKDKMETAWDYKAILQECGDSKKAEEQDAVAAAYEYALAAWIHGGLSD